MDLTAAITNFQQAKAMSGVQFRIARKILDMQEFEGAAAIKLIEAACKTAAGEGAASIGLGGQIDTYG